jgi:hypothetical protein
LKSGNCGKLHYDVVRRLTDEMSKLRFKILKYLELATDL